MRPTPTAAFMIEEGFATWDTTETELRVEQAYRCATIAMAMAKYERIDDHGYAAWSFEVAARARRQFRMSNSGMAHPHDSLSRSCDEAEGLGYAPDERFAVALEAKLWPNTV